MLPPQPSEWQRSSGGQVFSAHCTKGFVLGFRCTARRPPPFFPPPPARPFLLFATQSIGGGRQGRRGAGGGNHGARRERVDAEAAAPLRGGAARSVTATRASILWRDCTQQEHARRGSSGTQSAHALGTGTPNDTSEFSVTVAAYTTPERSAKRERAQHIAEDSEVRLCFTAGVGLKLGAL